MTKYTHVGHLIEGTPPNFVFKFIMLTIETLSCFAVKTA